MTPRTRSRPSLLPALLRILVVLLSGCSSMTTQLPGPTSGLKTLQGSSFELPATWSMQRAGDDVLLQDPDKEVKLWLVDVEEKSGADAIAAAWKRAVPGFARDVDDMASPPDTDNWDSITQVSYAVAPQESRAIAAIARIKDGIAYVALLDAALPALQRRRAQLAQILGSQKPPGFERADAPAWRVEPLDEALAADLDRFIEQARRETRVPGAAVAVVQGGKTVFARGYGTRRLGGAENVTPETAFMIGSVTKPLTSLMMAVLVERGLFRWSTPLRDLLPDFRLADAELTAKVDMRHSVCACTGLPRQDMELLFEYDGVSPERRLAQLATMKPTTAFGGTYQYSNDLVSAGGFAAALARWPRKALLDAYAATMQETVFDPLGMTSTSISRGRAARGNYALPHGVGIDGHYEELPLAYENFVNAIAPAGGAWSTVGDLARYLQLELALGRLPDGKRLLSEQGLLERRKPGIRIGPHSAYGLALVVADENGLRSLGHDGGTFGFSASMTIWPEQDLALVVLSNAQAAHAFGSLVRRALLERVLGIDKESGKLLAYYVKRRDERISKEMAKVTRPPERAWISSRIGDYENDALGKLALRRQGAEYRVDVGEWQSDVAEYTQAGQSTLVLVDPPAAGLKLQVQEAGELLLDAGQQKYVFRRKERGAPGVQ